MFKPKLRNDDGISKPSLRSFSAAHTQIIDKNNQDKDDKRIKSICIGAYYKHRDKQYVHKCYCLFKNNEVLCTVILDRNTNSSRQQFTASQQQQKLEHQQQELAATAAATAPPAATAEAATATATSATAKSTAGKGSSSSKVYCDDQFESIRLCLCTANVFGKACS